MKKMLVALAITGTVAAVLAANLKHLRPVLETALDKLDEFLEGGSDGPDDSDPEHPGTCDGDANGFLPGEDVRP